MTGGGETTAQAAGEGGDGRPVVHVVDDDEAVCASLALLLGSAGLTTRTHRSGTAFLSSLADPARGRIGCVLTDVQMPGLDGIELLHRLGAQGFPRPVVVMSAHSDVGTALRALRAGAFNIVEKPHDDEALFAVINDALAAPDTRPRADGPGAITAVRPDAAGAAARSIATLSPFERRVLELLVTGRPNKAVAHDLALTPGAIEIHRAQILQRLGVGSLVEAVRLAFWGGLTPAEQPRP